LKELFQFQQLLFLFLPNQTPNGFYQSLNVAIEWNARGKKKQQNLNKNLLKLEYNLSNRWKM
jgi:hypothetical protein